MSFVIFFFKAILFFLPVVLGLILPGYGQNDPHVFRNINTSSGLASNIVTNIIQDSKGFMWIATTNGLQKYNGYSFVSYHHDPYDPQSISSDNTTILLEDREDNIWISTDFLGFNHFNPSTGKNSRISDLKDSSFRDLDNSTSACLDTMGNVWLISLSTIAEYDIRLHKLISFDYLLPKDKSMGMTKSIICYSQYRKFMDK